MTPERAGSKPIELKQSQERNSRFTAGQKLTLSFLAMLGLMFAFSLVAWNLVRSLGGALDQVTDFTARKIEIAGNIRSGFDDMSAHTRSTHLNYVIHYLERNLKHESCGACHDAGMLKTNQEGFESATRAVRKELATLKTLVADNERASVSTLESAADAWSANYRDYLSQADRGKFNDAHQIITERMNPLLDKVFEQTDALETRQRDALAEAKRADRDVIARNRRISMVLIVLGLIISAGVFWTIRNIGETLRHLTGQLEDGASRVADVAGQLSAASHSLARGSSEQAASLEETSASAEQISSMVQEHASIAQGIAEHTTAAEKTVGAVSKAVEAMGAAIAGINSSSDKVAGIIKVIDEIAFQTNILALNAAVEAARAGESGLGFAVVADEVRNLAQRCSAAARDIAGLIEDATGKARDGRSRLEEVGKALEANVTITGKISTQAGRVSTGSQEQARAIAQISKTITQMEQVTRSTAAGAEESASAGEELNSHAQTMRGIAERLVAMVGRDRDQA